MVTGGDGSLNILDSTEIYDDNDWKTVAGKLPAPMTYLRAKTIENRVYLFGIYHSLHIILRLSFILGGKDSDSNYRNDILQYNPETEEWRMIGTMKETRNDHAVTVVSYKDYADWCE